MKEKEIEDKLEKNLNKIEPGLILIKRQKKVDSGIIDLFCKDKLGNYVIIEIKKKPDAKVIAQLAKYNMSLIKSGIRKKYLRTILVAQEIPHQIQEACEFLKFETKQVYKPKKELETDNIKNQFPTREELLAYIKQRERVNISMIARFFDIYHPTASDLVKDLNQDKLVNITKLGGSHIVTLK